MKAIILNSGLGSRMGVLTSEHPKCMTEIILKETILMQARCSACRRRVTEVVMTTGLLIPVLVNYCIVWNCRCTSLLSTIRDIARRITFIRFTAPGMRFRRMKISS